MIDLLSPLLSPGVIVGQTNGEDLLKCAALGLKTKWSQFPPTWTGWKFNNGKQQP
jgi:hypothetical protein